jgi:hypothetical protein
MREAHGLEPPLPIACPRSGAGGIFNRPKWSSFRPALTPGKRRSTRSGFEPEMGQVPGDPGRVIPELELSFNLIARGLDSHREAPAFRHTLIGHR